MPGPNEKANTSGNHDDHINADLRARASRALRRCLDDGAPLARKKPEQTPGRKHQAAEGQGQSHLRRREEAGKKPDKEHEQPHRSKDETTPNLTLAKGRQRVRDSEFEWYVIHSGVV